MKSKLLLATYLIVVVAALSAQVPRIFSSTELGVAFTPPRIEPTFDSPFQVFSFFLQPTSDFSASVNLHYQPFTGTMAEYDKLFSSSIAQLNLEVLYRNVTSDSVNYEYRGNYQGRLLHWYAIAKASGGNLYLATTTTLESMWENQKDVLKDSVASLNLNKILGLTISTTPVNPVESDFWGLLSQIDKLIFVRGLLDGVISEKTISYLILHELDNMSAEMTTDKKITRKELTDQYRAINQDFHEKISQSYSSSPWQQESVNFIDEFYQNRNNTDEPLSTAFFYYLNRVLGWGYPEK